MYFEFLRCICKNHVTLQSIFLFQKLEFCLKNIKWIFGHNMDLWDSVKLDNLVVMEIIVII